jgi:hypothetical protein
MFIDSHRNAWRRPVPTAVPGTADAAEPRASSVTTTASPHTAAVKSLAGTAAPSVPDLPDPTGPVAPANRVAQVVAHTSFAEGGDGLFAVLQVMTGARQHDVHLARLIKGMQTAFQMGARDTELRHKLKELSGERISSLWRVAGTLAATGLSFTVGAVGGSMEHRGLQGLSGNNIGHDIAWGAALKNAASISGQAVSSGFDALDRTGTIPGGRSAADRATVAQREASRLGQIAQTNADGAGTWLDQAQEARKSTQAAIMAAVQMWHESLANALWR